MLGTLANKRTAKSLVVTGGNISIKQNFSPNLRKAVPVQTWEEPRESGRNKPTWVKPRVKLEVDTHIKGNLVEGR